MTIASFFALSNKPTNFFRCIAPVNGRAAAPSLNDGIFPPRNQPLLSFYDHLAILTDDMQKAIFNRPLLESEAIAQVSNVHAADIATSVPDKRS